MIIKNKYNIYSTKINIIMITFVILIFFNYLFSSLNVPFNSDDAATPIYIWNLLYNNNSNNSILHIGLYNIIATIVFLFYGLSPETFYITTAVLYATLAFFVLTLINVNNKNEKNNNKLYLLFVCVYFLLLQNEFKYHLQSTILLYVLLFLINKYYKSKENKNIILIFIGFTTILTAVGRETLSYAVIFVPIWIFTIFYFLISKNKKNIFLLLTSISSFLIGKMIPNIVDYIFNSIPEPNTTSAYTNPSFGNIETIHTNILLFITALLNHFRANFFNKNVLDISNIFLYINIIFLIFGIYLVIKNIFFFFKKKIINDDIISFILSLSIILTSTAAIITNVAHDIPTMTRYINSLFPSILILVCRYINNNYGQITIYKAKLIKIIGYIFIVLILLNIYQNIKNNHYTLTRKHTIYDQVSDILYKNNLKYGYAHFWMSNYITVASNGNVKVQDLFDYGYGLNFIFRKINYDDEYYNFVVIDYTFEVLYFSEDRIKEFFGDNYLKLSIVDGIDVLIYDYDLSTKINNTFLDFKRRWR